MGLKNLWNGINNFTKYKIRLFVASPKWGFTHALALQRILYYK